MIGAVALTSTPRLSTCVPATARSSDRLRIELVTIGDELLLGFTIDTNAAHLARELAPIGIADRAPHDGRRYAADDIATAVREALDRTGAVITTGGLGPTTDDLTKQSIAELFGRAMRSTRRISRG